MSKFVRKRTLAAIIIILLIGASSYLRESNDEIIVRQRFGVVVHRKWHTFISKVKASQKHCQLLLEEWRVERELHLMRALGTRTTQRSSTLKWING
mmetsp:Transcript_11239/g.18171  ORF Transcript_11239/g.18171 Transcript_11239/m.18171 type:complete len:96 (+) Transcript_11239:1545-1832(+)